ncbi:hypothetical protein EBN03_26215 [Nocardia stercoris]|uniref:Copper chaperone PCu(A)C n=1 Tax=Nocardia stercoris TaxID=2483361 RepID=A0A3M2L0N0_9NOCA|nr:hypothetical protein EBN03_26215 [Nocardia stercoris]
MRRALAVAALAAGAALALSGCGAGQISQTASQQSAVNGNTADIGQLALRDVRILTPQSADYTNTSGGKAVLAFTVTNQSGSVADQLTSIKSDLGDVKLTPATVDVPPLKAVVAAAPGKVAADTGSGDAVVLVEISGLHRDVTPGLTYPVTFNFKQNGTVAVSAPVDAGSTPAKS